MTQAPEPIEIREDRRADNRPMPAVPAPYTDHDDVNPVCGCHKRAQCLGCGGCVNCAGCYCYED